MSSPLAAMDSVASPAAEWCRGAVVYQTYTRDQARYGKPSRPEYLLEPGELAEVFGDWEILKEREFTGPRRGSGEPSALASIIARKPPG